MFLLRNRPPRQHLAEPPGLNSVWHLEFFARYPGAVTNPAGLAVDWAKAVRPHCRTIRRRHAAGSDERTRAIHIGPRRRAAGLFLEGRSGPRNADTFRVTDRRSLVEAGGAQYP